MTWIPGLAGGGAGGGAAPAQLHDTTHSPVGLWQFDGDLLDTSGTGANLSVDVGTERYGVAAVPGLEALHLDGLTRMFSASPAPAALRILGNATWEGLVFPSDQSVARPVLLACRALVDSEAQADNILYTAEFATTPDSYEPTTIWERGAGVNNVLTAVFSVAPGRWHHYAISRDTSGGVGSTVCRIYINGTERASIATLDPPDGGGNAVVWFGARDTGFFFKGYLSTWKVVPSLLTPAQILAEARRTLPPDLRP